MKASTLTPSGTPMILATGAGASSTAPNEVHIKVTSGSDIVIGDADLQAYPLASGDPAEVFLLYGDDEVWVDGTGTVQVLETTFSF